MRSSIKTFIAVAGIFWTAMAQALTITSAQVYGSIPGAAATGLLASHYKSNQGISTLAQGGALVAGASGPTATFTALNVCFPSCNGSVNDGSTLASYIGSNGTDLIGSSAPGLAVTRFNGFIASPSATT